MIGPSLKIGYLSSENPENKRVWSGTHHSIFKSLQQLGNVEILGPYEPKWPVLLGRISNQLSLRLFKKRIDYRHSLRVSKGYGRYFTARLKAVKPDVIVAPAASAELAFVKTDIPVIYVSDGTFASCLNYHKALTNLTPASVSEGNQVEQAAMKKASRIIVSSEWAAQSAMRDYGVNKEKIMVMPFGANFDHLPASNELNREAPGEWKLLFVGVYWQNKGGDIAFRAFKQLADKDYNVSLTVLGCIPPEGVEHPNLHVIPFIDKNDPEGQKQLYEIYRQHHLLILPTRFDCTPIVINEASAFGMPSLVSSTGGVAGHLKEGINGFLFEYNDNGRGYAQKIESLIKSPADYLQLRESTRRLYEEQLNWQHWSLGLKKILEKIL